MLGPAASNWCGSVTGACMADLELGSDAAAPVRKNSHSGQILQACHCWLSRLLARTRRGQTSVRPVRHWPVLLGRVDRASCAFDTIGSHQSPSTVDRRRDAAVLCLTPAARCASVCPRSRALFPTRSSHIHTPISSSTRVVRAPRPPRCWCTCSCSVRRCSARSASTSAATAPSPTCTSASCSCTRISSSRGASSQADNWMTKIKPSVSHRQGIAAAPSPGLAACTQSNPRPVIHRLISLFCVIVFCHVFSVSSFRFDQHNTMCTRSRPCKCSPARW